MPSEKIELLQWLYVAIVAPILGGFGGWVRDWWSKRAAAKGRKKSLIQILSGLPPESKAALIDFHQHGTHTRRGDPFNPAIKVLVSRGVITPGPGGGTYDAVDRYLTIAPKVWEVMDDWVLCDAVDLVRVREEFFESS